MSIRRLPLPLARLPLHRLGSLRLRLACAVPVLSLLVLLGFDWSVDGPQAVRDNLVRSLWLALWLSLGLLLLIEALLLRPLRRLASGWEALESVPPQPPTEGAPSLPRLALEFDRLGDAMRRAQGSRWQQDQDAQRLRHELSTEREALAQAQEALASSQRALAGLARTDELTGLANRRAFDEALRREFKRAQRQRGLLALAVLDLDQFKQFNQRHGHEAGDRALQHIATLLCERLQRDTDVVARLGGEEFVALLPGFGMAEAQGVLESLRDELRAQRLVAGDAETVLTVSVGLAAMSPAHPYLSAQALLQAADEALYMAKHAGRDRLSLAA